MPLNVAIQMDPPETLDYKSDSTVLLALEAQRRNYAISYYTPQDMSQRDETIFAYTTEIAFQPEEPESPFKKGNPHKTPLSTFDLILMRQDPPFDMAYITATHMLDTLERTSQTKVLNNPNAVRNAPEKLMVTQFPDLMPPTLITNNHNDIKAFYAEYNDIIIKPLYGNGGSQIFHISPESDNLSALLETFSSMYREPIVVQKYLPEIKNGDKRIILCNGEPIGAINRIPQHGDVRANLHVGGKAEKTTLTDREHEICKTISTTLKEQKLIFAGIDVIGNDLTEINVTSPTGLPEINALDGNKDENTLQSKLWDEFERVVSDK